MSDTKIVPLKDMKVKYDFRQKRNFSPSDFGKPTLDIYFAFKGVVPTNETLWYETLKWGAGHGVEAAMLEILKYNGIVWEHYDQDFDGLIETTLKIGENVLPIKGFTDARVIKVDEPIEIKSINNKNIMDVRDYDANKPRKNYVGQLAMYMEFLKKDRGHLFVASIDGLHRYWFECRKIAPGKYQCGEVVVDVHEEFERWSKIWTMLQNGESPDIWEYRYKHPIEEVNWKALSTDKVRKARSGEAVVGDWQISWSPYKDLIVQLQGETLGYTFAELEKIKELTKGYTSKKVPALTEKVKNNK
jgi:hypothetical protein